MRDREQDLEREVTRHAERAARLVRDGLESAKRARERLDRSIELVGQLIGRRRE